MVLAFIGGALGLLFSFAAVRLLVAYLPNERLPFQVDVSVDSQVLAFTLGLSVVTGLLFGLWPALQTSRIDIQQELKSNPGQLGLGRNLNGRRTLVILQVGISSVLVMAAGLFIRTLRNTASVDLGLNVNNVLVASFNPELSGYSLPQSIVLYRDLQRRLGQMPGVRAVGLASTTLLSRGLGEPRPIARSQTARPAIRYVEVSGNFFTAAGIRILRGRSFGPEDGGSTRQVAIVNETAARELFRGSEPVGRTLQELNGDVVVVGIAQDSKLLAPREDRSPVVYLLADQSPHPSTERTLYLRTSADPRQEANLIRQTVHQFDSSLPVYNVKTMAEQKSESMSEEQLIADLSGFFGGLSLLLAAIGLYGVMASDMLRRKGEIGIRVSLGASRTRIICMVLKESIFLTLMGLAVGVPLYLFASRYISSYLFGVVPNDLSGAAVTVALLLSVALVAGYFPARAASRDDASVSLKCD